MSVAALKGPQFNKHPALFESGDLKFTYSNTTKFDADKSPILTCTDFRTEWNVEKFLMLHTDTAK